MFQLPSPELESRTVVPIYQFQKGRPVHVLALSPLEGFYTHFESRTRVCPGVMCCRLCDLGRSRRYLGFFAGWIEQRRYLVRLTSEAALRLAAHPPAPGAVYRIESKGSRKPLQVSAVGQAGVPEGKSMSQIELLSVLASIHGLGIVPTSCTYEDGLRRAHDAAKRLIDGTTLAIH